jgi:hypothetical protein
MAELEKIAQAIHDKAWQLDLPLTMEECIELAKVAIMEVSLERLKV